MNEPHRPPSPPQRRPASCLAAGALALSLVGCAAPSDATRTTLLWPDGAPRARGKAKRDRPELFYFVPPADRRTGAAAVVASGGSYGHHGGLKPEGFSTARWLVDQGITAVVVRYRVGGPGPYNHVDFIADGKRAVRTVRAQANDLGIDPDKIGMIGFSAGGHLASSVGIHCADDNGDPDASDPVERVSCRISYAVLIYPVITLEAPHAHIRSRNNLLNGIRRPSVELKQQLSTHTQVHASTAPMFIVHSKRDTKVDWQNSQLIYDALVKHNVDAKLLLAEDGRHGVGLADDPERMPQMSTWPGLFLQWVEAKGLL